MTVHVEVERTFVASLARVWDRFTDHAGWTEWAGVGRVHLERVGEPERNGVGCVRVFHNPGLSVREEVVEFEPRQRMVYRLLESPGVREHRGEVTFEDIGAGHTRVVWRCQFDATVPGTAWALHKGVSFFFARTLRRFANAV